MTLEVTVYLYVCKLTWKAFASLKDLEGPGCDVIKLGKRTIELKEGEWQ